MRICGTTISTVHLAHRYFDTTHSIVRGAVDSDFPALETAVPRVLGEIAD